MENKFISKGGPTIFQQIVVPFMITSFIVITALQVSNYFSQRALMSQEVKTRFSDSLTAAAAYFDATYALPIQHDLKFIENSYAFNSFLGSKKDEILLTKPLAERLFLHFTNRDHGVYLSLRFIDTKGVEKVATEGNKRQKKYVSLATAPKDALHDGTSVLFSKLKAGKPGVILCEGPFEYQGKWTFLAGTVKSEPDIGAAAGVVIFHCDLTEYFSYLTGYEFYGERVATVVSLDYKLMFSPLGNEAVIDFRKDPGGKQKYRDFYYLAKEIKIGSNAQALINVVFRISPRIFQKETEEILTRSLLCLFLAVFFISAIVLGVSRNFSRPLVMLINSIKQFAQGDLSARAHVKTTGEIQLLVEAFNRMAEDLNKTTVSRDSLIKEVNERRQAEADLRESQQLLGGIMDLISVRIFWKDKNLVYLGCNAAFARDAGFADPKDLIGKDDYQMVWRDQAELYRSDDRQIVESGCSKLLIEEPQTTSKGETITLLTNKIPLRTSEGEIIGVLGTYVDITERIKVEEKEKKQLKELDIFYKASVGREERVIELKKEIERLKKELGK